MNQSIYEWLMGMDDASWERHENPLSGWTRLLVLPAFALAVWSRLWLGWWALFPIVAVLLFTFINPRLFPPPENDRSWMTRGVRGERIWLARKHQSIPPEHARVTAILLAFSAIGIPPFIYGLVYYDFPWLVVGLILIMGGKLWFFDRMVWLYALSRTNGKTGA